MNILSRRLRMDYADRISNIPPYLFAGIDKKIVEKKKQGVDVINLGVGDPDLPTPSNIVDKLSEAARSPRNQRYPSYVGMLSFREAVANWYKRRFNVTLDPEGEVITLIGSKEGIGHTPLAFVNPGDVALVPDPAYPVYKVSVILAGGKPVQMPLLEGNGFTPDLSAIDVRSAGKAKLMFLNYPNNPTAAVVDRQFFREVVDFAEDNGVVVCHDAPYSEITFDGYVSPSFLETMGAKEVGVEFHSLSKTYNMTGWRIGFAVGNRDVIAGLGKVKENVDSGVFQAIQHAGIEALNGPQDGVKSNVKVLKRRRDVMVEGLDALGWEVTRPKATFYLWVRCPVDMPSLEFSGMLLDKAGVVVTPGVGFGEYGEGYVRMALTQSEDRLQEALDRIGKIGLPKQ